jgi:hypothetical protein
MTNKTIKLRAHHLRLLNVLPDDIVTDFIPQYGISHSRVIRRIVGRILENGSQLVKIVAEFDDICQECPHRHNRYCTFSKRYGGSTAPSELVEYDQRVARELGVEIDEVLTSDQLLKRIFPKFGRTAEFERVQDYISQIEKVRIESYMRPFPISRTSSYLFRFILFVGSASYCVNIG